MKRLYPKQTERGAALMMVLVIVLLLGTACIALLSAVGYSSQNNTDALNEAKAYWAAESGLQATINYLRNTPNMTYSLALDNQANGVLPVSAGNVGTETAYTVQIVDPDAALPYTFSVGASFRAPVPTTSPAPVLAELRTSPTGICIPGCAAVDRTEVSFTPMQVRRPSHPFLCPTRRTTPWGHTGWIMPETEHQAFPTVLSLGSSIS